MLTRFARLISGLASRIVGAVPLPHPLSGEEWRVLRALSAGKPLKSHRFLDGRKLYQIHRFDGDVEEDVPAQVVEHLKARGLIDSNMKFPAATYLLTDKGAALIAQLDAATAGGSTAAPLTTRLPRPSGHK